MGQLFIDAIYVNLSAIHKTPEEELKESVLDFIAYKFREKQKGNKRND